MAAWGYEFYLRVLKVSLKSERILFVTDTDEISFFIFLFIFETAKNGPLLQNACHRNVM